MKLSRTKRSSIVEEILDSLFIQPRKALEEKQDTLANEIWEHEIRQYQELLSQLPEKFYKTDDYVYLKFIDPRPENTTKAVVKWRSEFTQPVIICTDNTSWGSNLNVSTPIVDTFKDRIIDLLTAQDKLKKERDTLKAYLNETINSVNTTKQLKVVWDEVFHKFIPIDPPRTPQTKKADVEATLSTEIPDIDKVKGRMVDNLLKAS